MPIKCIEMVEFRLYFTPEQAEKVKKFSGKVGLQDMVKNDFPGFELMIFGAVGDMRAYLDAPADVKHHLPNILAAIENWFATQ